MAATGDMQMTVHHKELAWLDCESAGTQRYIVGRKNKLKRCTKCKICLPVICIVVGCLSFFLMRPLLAMYAMEESIVHFLTSRRANQSILITSKNESKDWENSIDAIDFEMIQDDHTFGKLKMPMLSAASSIDSNDTANGMVLTITDAKAWKHISAALLDNRSISCRLKGQAPLRMFVFGFLLRFDSVPFDRGISLQNFDGYGKHHVRFGMATEHGESRQPHLHSLSRSWLNAVFSRLPWRVSLQGPPPAQSVALCDGQRSHDLESMDSATLCLQQIMAEVDRLEDMLRERSTSIETERLKSALLRTIARLQVKHSVMAAQLKILETRLRRMGASQAERIVDIANPTSFKVTAALLIIAKIIARIVLYSRSHNVSLNEVSDMPHLERIGSPGVGRRGRLSSMDISGDQVASSAGSAIDFPLLACVVLWLIGNYFYNITSKLALTAVGGVDGFPLTIATMQLGIGVVYTLFLWLAPGSGMMPSITPSAFIKTVPIGVAVAGMHVCSVVALSAGAVSFAQLIKAAEPVFAVILGSMFCGDPASISRWLCVVPIAVGIVIACFGEIPYSWVALGSAALANCFAVFKANRSKASTMRGSDRTGSLGNRFAFGNMIAFLICLPLMLWFEGHHFTLFMEICQNDDVLLYNMLFSGFWLYLYAELATLSLENNHGSIRSAANTAKHLVMVFVVALVMGEHLGALKFLGCTFGIGGALLYSIIDRPVKRMITIEVAGDNLINVR